MPSQSLVKRIGILSILISVNGHDWQSRPGEGTPCSLGDPKWYPTEDSPHDFLYCHAETKVFTRQKCSTSYNGQQKIFDPTAQQCVLSSEGKPGHFSLAELFADNTKDSIFGAGPRTGDPCQFDSDCPQNAMCTTKGTCECRISYLEMHRLCWQNMAPTEGPCIIDEQCSSAWPKSECYRATCICPKGMVPVNTSGGILCSELDKCPLGGPYLLAGSRSQQIQGADPCAMCNEPNDGQSASSLYECIKGAGFSKSVCCPNKALTCMQPLLSGNGKLNVTRYAYNPLTDECREFEFYGGTMINSNVFHTKVQCENYCRRGCLRGNPEVRMGHMVSCANDEQCTAHYRCYKRDGAEPGMCCPTPESICNPFGGVGLNAVSASDAIDTPLKEFDPGEEPEKALAIYFPAVRYYYSASERQCKTFLYRGVGGNFNNFLTMEHCQTFCSAAICPSGKPAVNTKTHRWLRCRADGQCPPDFFCQNGSCCGGPKTKKIGADFAENACPRGTHPAMRELGGVIFCDAVNTCPEDAFCRVSSTSVAGEGICCAGHILEFQSPRCPGNGSSPMMVEKHRAVPCSLGQQIGCAAPYTCAYASINATDGICCSVPAESVVCPLGMEPVMAEDGKYHQQCSPLHLTTCPDGGACVFNELYGIYYCCRNATHDCPNGRRPYIEPHSNNPLNCTYNCPSGFACLDSPVSTGKRTCCSEHPLVKYCIVGKALTNNEGIAYSCSAEAKCPPGYYCVPTPEEGNVCCPKSDHVCSLNADFGSACTYGLETVSYYFDPTYKTCRPFLYRGCGGNDNRFADVDHCEAFCHMSTICRHGQPAMTEIGTMKRQRPDGTISCSESGGCPDGYSCAVMASNHSHCCPAPETVCKQAKASGLLCDDVVRDVHDFPRVWYFDLGAKACQPMTFYGCAGNANRFHTQEACEQFCFAIVCPGGGSPQVDDGKMKYCYGDSDCKSGHQCTAPTGNSGGPSVCCPSPEAVCSSPIRKGEACGAPEVRYAFNQTSGTCEPFSYLGCRGNDNNFRTEDVCKKICLSARSNAQSAICPDSPHVHVETSDSLLKRCRKSDDCPLMHQCTFPDQKGLGLGYCCPMPKQKCLAQPPLWTTNQKRLNNDQCSSHIDSTCPANYSCQLTEAGYRKCCMDPDISQVCPVAKLRGKVGQLTLQRCDDSDDQCSPGYSCRYSRQFGRFFCCPMAIEQQTRSLPAATMAEDRMCPGGTTPYMDPYYHTVRVCSPYLRFSCPMNYECLYNARAARYHCCILEEPVVSAKEWAYRLACPTGQAPYFQSDDRPVVCQPSTNSKDPCPSPSSCQYSPLYWQFICCMVDEQAALTGNSSSVSVETRVGRIACEKDVDCRPLPGTICRNFACKCPHVMLYYTCVDECPPNYIRTPDDRCQLPMFDFQYYRQAANRRSYYAGSRQKH